jgi:hypothetical protein
MNEFIYVGIILFLFCFNGCLIIGLCEIYDRILYNSTNSKILSLILFVVSFCIILCSCILNIYVVNEAYSYLIER